MHVVIDRTRNAAAESGLRTESGLLPEEIIFVAQVHTALGPNGFKRLVEALCHDGWGYGRTAGYGHVALIGIERLDRPNPTGWVATLGHVHPTDDLPEDGYWRWAGVPVRPHDTNSRRGPAQLFTTMLLPGASLPTDSQCVGATAIFDGRPDYLHFGIAPTWPILSS